MIFGRDRGAVVPCGSAAGNAQGNFDHCPTACYHQTTGPRYPLIRPTIWDHYRHTNLVRIASPLRADMIFGNDRVRGRVQLTNGDRLFLVQLYRWFPSVLQAITIIRPETLVRWHRAGFRQYWRWQSRSLGGRPKIAADLRALIRRMSAENPLWGAPRIHGELLNYGARRASMVSCSSSASRSLSRASRSTWSSDVDPRPRDGAPSCVTTHRTSPPWTCSLFRPLASICSIRLLKNVED